MSGVAVRNWWQQPYKVEAAGVEVAVAPRLRHQDSLGVVVKGGDAGRHADSKGEPGDAGETDGRGERGSVSGRRCGTTRVDHTHATATDAVRLSEREAVVDGGVA